MIIEQYQSPPITVTDKIPKTTRGDKDFGSTNTINTNEHKQKPHVIPVDDDQIPASKTTIINKLRTTVHSGQLQMNFVEPIFTTSVNIKNAKKYPLLGLKLKNDDKGPVITSCIIGSPAAKVHRWRQVLKGARLYAINDIMITPTTDIQQILNDISSSTIEVTVVPIHPTHLHLDTGVPQ